MPKTYTAPPGFVLNPAGLVDELESEIQRLRDELQVCCELKRKYQEQAASVVTAPADPNELGPLPEPFRAGDLLPDTKVYTADACWFYAGREVIAERERSAKLHALTDEELAVVNKFRAQREWAKRDLTACKCDHNEYCEHCYPLSFRPGGVWWKIGR